MKGSTLPPMAGLALATSDRPMGDFLDHTILSKAYASAYQLMFARAMVDVLGVSFVTSKETIGQEKVKTEAVVLEPVFVYVVEGLLGIISVATFALLVLTLVTKRNLRCDPSTIASVMAIVADNQPLLSDLQDLDCCTTEDMGKLLGQKRYKLLNDESGTR
jgi:hypothetical protein